jgi:hypothetical protein
MDFTSAGKILQRALAKADNPSYAPTSTACLKIADVILGGHKTFRYILITGLLAKAADSSVNPLCLQAHAGVTGAFDARSLCHKVLVPFERKFLHSKLGGSNEPFLNKPARFPMLSSSNAVRAGTDKKALEKTISILGNAKNSEQAFNLLVECLHFALKRDPSIQPSLFDSEKGSFQPYDFYDIFFHHLLNDSCGGESPVLAAAYALKISLERQDSFKVQVHKANQCGASSKEYSDIDVYYRGRLYLCAEVKDKPFSETDVEHAVKKAASGHPLTLLFLFGQHAIYPGLKNDIPRFLDMTKSYDLHTRFFSIPSFLSQSVSLFPQNDLTSILKTVESINREASFSDKTVEHIKSCIEKARESI